MTQRPRAARTTGSDQLATVVVTAIADQEGIDPTDLDPPLYEVVDPEALNRLFADTTGRVSFEYHGYLVTVDAEGSVTLTDAHRV